MAMQDIPVRQALSVANLLATPSIAPLYAGGAALLLACGDPPSLVFASASAAQLFGANDINSLRRLVFERDDDSALRLDALTRSLMPDGPPRLARVRVFVDRRALALTILCRRIALSNHLPLFLFVVHNVPHVLIRSTSASGDLKMAMLEDGTQTAAAPGTAADATVCGVPAPPAAIEAVQRGFAQRYGERSHLRFVWRADRDHLFTFVSSEIAQVTGVEPRAIVGTSLAWVLERYAVERREAAAVLNGLATWGPIALHWPIAATRTSVTIELFGAPRFGPLHAFEGYAGFGLLHLDQIVAADDSESALQPGQVPPAGASVAQMHEPDQQSPATAVTWQNVVHLRPLEASVRQGLKVAGHRLGEVESVVELRPGRLELGDGGLREVAEAPVVMRGHVEMAAGLSLAERQAFRDIAQALGVRIHHDDLAGLAETPAAEAQAVDGIDPFAAELEDRALDAWADPAADAWNDPIPEPQVDVATAAGPMPQAPEHPASGPCAVGSSDAANILEHVPIGVLVLRGTVPLYLNATLLDLVGCADFESFRQGGGFAEVFGRSDLARLIQGDAGQISIVTLEGNALKLDARAEAIDWRGEPAVLLSFRRSFEEIADANLAELTTRLRKSGDEAAELQAMLDTASDGIVVVDSQGAIRSLNRAAQALFGLASDEAAGKEFSFLFAPESRLAVMDGLARCKQHGTGPRDGWEVVGRPVNGAVLPLFITMGQLPGSKYCAVLRDQTLSRKVERELREARQQAEHANQLKSDFLARVSHEIRTPLNAILGFAEVMVEERFGPIGNERYKDYLKDIHASGAHLMSLVNDLLDLSKIEAGKMELTFTDVDANKVVAESIALMQPQASRERVIIRMALASRLPRIVADERSLRQIVLNLLSNAVKFNEPGGQVIVSSAVGEAGQAIVRIRDTGIGMSESDVEIALEPFRQLPTSRKTSGTGLGLPLTKALIEANRASFSIKSRKNEGTLVEIAFPPAQILAAE
jgi:PAS domain S-box-containing protein